MNSNLAPEIFRKRLIVEGKYTVAIDDKSFAEKFLKDLTAKLGNTIIAGPFISSADGKAKPLHNGYEGAVIWAESGANTYIWTDSKFCTVDVYSCQDFSTAEAVEYIREYFGIHEFSYYVIPDPTLAANQDTRLEYRNTQDKGIGVFAREFIPKETTISYVDGPVHYAEIESQIYPYADHAIPFHKYFYRDGFNTFAVNLNHSCEPNCYAKNLFFITTMHDIQPGEELTYCYSLFCNSDWENPEGVCLCGSQNCYGKIVPWREMTKEDKVRFLPYTADWILLEEMKNRGMIDDLKKLI